MTAYVGIRREAEAAISRWRDGALNINDKE
jgi:hypothetical protein